MEHGAQKVLIRTVDTDVVVIAIAEYSKLCLTRPDVSVCFAFGMGKYFQYISIDTICEALGPRKRKRFHYTIPSPAAIPHCPSREKEKVCEGRLECV